MAFEAIVEYQDDIPVVKLKDQTTGTYAEVYAFGALLNKFCIHHQEQEFNVVDGFRNVEHALATLTPFFKGAKLSPFVCRVKNHKYHFGETSHLLSKYALGNHAIHGLIYDATFSVIETIGTEELACVRLQHVYDRQDEGFPFAYRCEVEYALRKDNQLTVKTTVTNVDEQLLPITDGWHPYFTLHDPVDECQLEFQSKEMLEFDDELIPTGKLVPYQEFGSLQKLEKASFDNCFTMNFAECQPLCVFRNPQRKIQLEIYPSHEYPYLQIYTPDHRKSIALENLSAAPDAFNNGLGLKVLEPHESATFITKFVIKQL
ncbi:aldose 1-epimerase [Aridibaculum aurantiacum]|uniref:aldose 1-epimerase n=1 Tax=Aridibaculum aurantiacum TaxID=2810307 RepID=UPI001A974B11|nr:aldose 1-epimerase [Aridibaculum aurantiacum]